LFEKYGGVLLASFTGARYIDEYHLVVIHYILDNEITSFFVFVSEVEIIAPFRIAFIIQQIFHSILPVTLALVGGVPSDNPMFGEPIVDFVDSVVLDVEGVGLFFVDDDGDGILSTEDRKVIALVRKNPVVSHELADLGGINFPVDLHGPLMYIILAGVGDSHAVQTIFSPVILEGADQGFLLLVETVRFQAAGKYVHVQILRHIFRGKVVKCHPDTIDRVNVHRNKRDNEKRFHVKHSLL
jgi:hypothetical protein